MHTCNKCEKTKPRDYFYKHPATKSGLQVRCKLCMKIAARARPKDKERVQAANKAYREANPEKVKKENKIWKEANKEKVREHKRQWNLKNPEKKKEQDRKGREKRATIPEFVAADRLRKCIKSAFKRRNHRKSCKSAEILGISFVEAKIYLEGLFKERYGRDLDWLNDQYHIDHIRPVCSIRSMTEVEEISHYTNLQILTPEDNRKKGGRF